MKMRGFDVKNYAFEPGERFGALRSGGLESQNFQSFTNLSNSFLLFTKLTKKEI
ncbi:hypothetical protein PIECOFPK_02380 [Mycovorax composti]|uniref:Uncharacterized protein n=1 Tax=Mycovorax composti TaxID=2962693 RepID=A0ABZ2ENA4_9BACT